ncbi:MAG: LysM domain-containing protein [Myxococcota bacterium]
MLFKPRAQAQTHKVQAGETLQSLATGAGLSVEQLAIFNWGVSSPWEINECLYTYVGCRTLAADGVNFEFDGTESPGTLEIPGLFQPQSGMAVDKTYTVRVKAIEPKPFLRITALHDHFASGAEDAGLHFSIGYLEGEQVTIRVTSDHYADGVIFEHELDDEQKRKGRAKAFAWQGETTCAAGDLQDLCLSPLYSPYKLTIEAAGGLKDEREFKVLYGKLELSKGAWLADETTPPADTDDWDRWKLNELGYFGGPFTDDGAETAYQRGCRERAIKLYKCHDGEFLRRVVDDHGAQVEADPDGTAYFDFLDDAAGQFGGLLRTRLAADHNRRDGSENLNALPAPGQDARFVVPLVYYAKGDDFQLAGEVRYDQDAARVNDPFVPIKVKVYLRDHQDRDVHSPMGVGKARVGWRVVDPAEPGMNARYQEDVRYRAADAASRDTQRLAYMQAVQNHIQGAGYTYSDGTAFVKNCPGTFGGKDQLTDLFLSWKGFPLVERNQIPCSEASVDSGNDKLFGYTGANFVPSKIGGDSYQVIADLDFSGLPNEDDLKDWHGANAEGRDAGKVETGTFTIWRAQPWSKIVSWPGVPAGQYQLQRVRTYFEQCYVKFDVPGGGAIEDITDVISEQEYRTLVAGWSPEGLQRRLKRRGLSSSDANRVVGDAKPGKTLGFFDKFSLTKDAFFGRDVPAQKRLGGNEYKAALRSLFYDNSRGFVSKLSEPMAALLSRKLRARHPMGHIVVAFRPHEPVTVYKAPGLIRRGEVDTANYRASFLSMGLADGIVTYDLGDGDRRGFVLAHEFGHHHFLYHHEVSNDPEPPPRVSETPEHHDGADHNCIMSYLSFAEDTTLGEFNPLFCGKCNLRLRGWQVGNAALPASS